MAYAIENTKSRQAQTFIAVGLLHSVAIWAIASGFANSVIEVARERFIARQWEDEEVKITPIAPPPESKPSAKAEERPFVTPRPDIAIDPVDPTFTIRQIEVTPIEPAEFRPITPSDVRPSPAPSFAVRAASPKGSPAAWVSDRDYPSAAIREEREGQTRFRLSIGVDGRVTDCQITKSSGSQDLDAATCAKVSARARFVPALADDGMPTVGTYVGSIRWVLP